MPLSHAGLGFSWEIFPTSWAEHRAVSHSEDQFETEMLKIEYASIALDVSSINRSLGMNIGSVPTRAREALQAVPVGGVLAQGKGYILRP